MSRGDVEPLSTAIGSPFTQKRLGPEEIEQRALEIIKSRGEEGIYQHELWKALGLDSREGSRLALRLLKKGLIVREPTVHNGRRTYKLFLARKERKRTQISINIGAVIEVPCFTCKHVEKCYEGGYFDPATCPILRKWLDQKVALMKKIISH
ncbi:MAG: transcription factor TFIIIC [Hyperthermus sp.]|nr:MAG: transcription factor TFIIIC [Hyperthermus sp.]